MGQKNVADCAYELFGIRIASERGRFHKPGWFDVGPTVCTCPQCSQPLWGFRSPYISANKTFYYWALVCRDCKTAIRPNTLSDEQRKLLYASSLHRPSESISKDDSFLMFEKLQRYAYEIRSFFVQIKPVKEATNPYFIGDGESWLREIERQDLSRGNKDAFRRVAEILFEWSNECLDLMKDAETEKVVKKFQRTLTGDPCVGLDFLKSLSRINNEEMRKKMAMPYLIEK